MNVMKNKLKSRYEHSEMEDQQGRKKPKIKFNFFL